MLNRNPVSALFLICTCLVVLALPIARAEESQSMPVLPSEETRIDRTDFPVRYLATPCLQGEAVWKVQARLKELGYEITRWYF